MASATSPVRRAVEAGEGLTHSLAGPFQYLPGDEDRCAAKSSQHQPVGGPCVDDDEALGRTQSNVSEVNSLLVECVDDNALDGDPKVMQAAVEQFVSQGPRQRLVVQAAV